MALVGHPSSDGVMIRERVLLPRPASHPILMGFIKTESDFIVKSVETGLRVLMLLLFLAFSDLTGHLEDKGIGVFWLHCVT